MAGTKEQDAAVMVRRLMEAGWELWSMDDVHTLVLKRSQGHRVQVTQEQVDDACFSSMLDRGEIEFSRTICDGIDAYQLTDHVREGL